MATEPGGGSVAAEEQVNENDDATVPDDPGRRLPQVQRILDRMTPGERVAQAAAVVLPQSDTAVEGLLDEWAETGPPGVVLVPSLPPVQVRDRLAALQEVLSGARLAMPALAIAMGHPAGEPYLPDGVACAATWSPELVERVAEVAAATARAAGVHSLVVPVGSQTADGSDGRTLVDPVLGAAIAAAQVAGLQGEPSDDGRLGPERVAAGIGPLGALAEGSLHERTLRALHLVAAEAAVRAGASIVVPSRVSNAGVPGHTDPWLMRDVLRGEWQFSGVVLAAAGEIDALMSRHRVAGSIAEAMAVAADAGVDVVATGPKQAAQLAGLLVAGELPRWIVDDAVAAVLTLKLRLGLLDGPAAAAPEPGPEALRAAMSLARNAAASSFVLLTDPAGVLPLPGSGVVEVVPDGEIDPRVAEDLGRALDVMLPDTLVRTPASGPAEPTPGESVVLVTTDPARSTTVAARAVATGRKCVVVACTDDLERVGDVVTSMASVLICWAAAARQLEAVADVLVGAVDAGGRLPVALPIGRSGGASFPLGHGLGGASFQLSALRISPAALDGPGAITVRVTVTNRGGRSGRAVVQVYFEGRTGTISRGARTLAAFATAELPEGGVTPITMRIPAARLAVWDRGMRHVVEPGRVEVLVGASAGDIHQRDAVSVDFSGAPA